MKKIIMAAIAVIAVVVMLSVGVLAAEETESNNTAQSANLIDVNDSVTGSISASGDVDWYVFEVPADGYVEIEFIHEITSSSHGLWTLIIYKEDAVTGVCDTETGWEITGNSNRITPQIGLYAGKYYVKITKGANYSSSSKYIFKVNYTETEFTEKESNSNNKRANLIKTNKEYRGSITVSADVDWFAFTLKASSEVTVNLTHEIFLSTHGYWIVRVYESDGVTAIKGAEVPGNANRSLNIGLMKPGMYYVSVSRGPNYSFGGTYKLSVSEKHNCDGDYIITKDPTCTEEGEKRRFCKVCEKLIDTQSIDATGHKSDKWTVYIEPTCTEEGENRKLCNVCGEVVATQPINAAGHRSDGWTVDAEPTCNSTGLRHTVCSACNENVTEEIAKLEHIFGQWSTTKEATCKIKGKEERACSLCNYKEENVIEKLEHDFGDWEVVSGNIVIPPIVKEQECELCGYTETIKDWGYVWVTVLAGLAVIGLCVGVVAYFKAYR